MLFLNHTATSGNQYRGGGASVEYAKGSNSINGTGSMKRIVGIAVGSAALAAAFTGGALADGAPAVRRGPVAAPAVVEDRCGYGPWTGFYVGGNLGAAWTEHDFRDRDGMFDNGFETVDGRLIAGRRVFNHTETSFTGGVQAGYNYQCKNWLIGFETDFNGVTNGNHDERRFFVNNVGDMRSFRRNDDTSWFGTIRGRLGWTDNRFLVYATGGAAYTDLRHRVRGVDFFFDNEHNFNDDVTWGWTAGGGVEYLHSRNITFKVEALWMDFSNNHRNERAIVGVDEFESPINRNFRMERDDQLWTLRVGVNYLFGGREPEVVPLK